MKLIKLGRGQICQEKDVPGLLSCRIEYEIKSGTGRLQYNGPKFAPAMWHQVLSFFRWTNKEMASESQVRLYVNIKLGRWGAWAFPQEARTGMSAREIVVQETPEQARERFAAWAAEPSADWLYFCTVHHHCEASAFQSGTDEANERNQDGLHLTVGHLDADRHDLHARFYLAGNCFEPDLSLFWPVEPELAAQVPATLLDAVARFQMGGKVVVDFPDQWRKNVIEQRRAVPAWEAADHHGPWDPCQEVRPPDRPEWLRAEAALREISTHCQEEDFLVALQACADSPDLNLLVAACLKHQVTPDDLLEAMQSPEPGHDREPGF
jgi:hypothetical protein